MSTSNVYSVYKIQFRFPPTHLSAREINSLPIEKNEKKYQKRTLAILTNKKESQSIPKIRYWNFLHFTSQIIIFCMLVPSWKFSRKIIFIYIKRIVPCLCFPTYPNTNDRFVYESASERNPWIRKTSKRITFDYLKATLTFQSLMKLYSSRVGV